MYGIVSDADDSHSVTNRGQTLNKTDQIVFWEMVSGRCWLFSPFLAFNASTLVCSVTICYIIWHVSPREWCNCVLSYQSLDVMSIVAVTLAVVFFLLVVLV